MSIFSKLSTECRKDNEIFAKQLRELVSYFSDINDTDIAQCVIDLVMEISKKSKLETKKNLEEIIKENIAKLMNDREIKLSNIKSNSTLLFKTNNTIN